MARETKAERLAREEAERAKYVAQFVVQYPRRLLQLVYAYSNTNSNRFSVKYNSEEDTFTLTMTESDWSDQYVFPAILTEYKSAYDSDMYDAESMLESYARELAEEARRATVRAEAWKKVNEMFNAEEQKLLGLK